MHETYICDSDIHSSIKQNDIIQTTSDKTE